MSERGDQHAFHSVPTQTAVGAFTFGCLLGCKASNECAKKRIVLAVAHGYLSGGVCTVAEAVKCMVAPERSQLGLMAVVTGSTDIHLR